jgi:hypothetical protein
MYEQIFQPWEFILLILVVGWIGFMAGRGYQRERDSRVKTIKWEADQAKDPEQRKKLLIAWSKADQIGSDPVARSFRKIIKNG